MLSQKADELKKSGVDVINLTTGEPDFNTPTWICEAATRAMAAGQTKYTAVGGTPALKNAIQRKFKTQNNLEYADNQIIVATGGKQILFNALMASLNPGDEVIIPAPYWVSYLDMVNLFEAKPIIVECTMEQNFRLSADQLRQAITPKTKWIIFNAPSNPTGTLYTKSELRAIADVLLDAPHVHIISDDIYEHLIYGESNFLSLPMIEPRLFDRTLSVNGVSKTYAMTGWRIGYAGGPRDLIKAMVMLQSQSTSNACSISQAAAVEALDGPQDFLDAWKKAYVERRDFIVDALNQIHGLECLKPEGAFYVYPKCTSLIGKRTPKGTIIENDADFAQYLLDEARVAVVPGSAFGLSPFIRLSYAIDKAALEEAAKRIARALTELN
jgi:aspartate aminotransferase